MKAFDFEYAGRSLSSFGMIICNFGNKGLETLSNGFNITFDTVSTLNGSKFELVSTKYEECVTTTFQICKCSCSTNVEEITISEYRELVRWLNRKKFLKFKIIDENYIDLYYEASFNISRIELDGKLYGLELEVITNRPFALKEPKTIVINNTSQNGEHSFSDSSDEEGYIYPYTEITIIEDGDLDIYNALENRKTSIKGCVAGEVITMDYPVIHSTISSHNICNDFNWTFLRVANTYDNRKNDLTISIPCTVKIRYSPIVKIGL